MKRSGIKRGSSQLKRTSSLNRSTLKAKPKKRPLFDEREMRREWHDHVIAQAPTRGRHHVCPVCGVVPSQTNRFEAHHVTTKEAIKNYVDGLGLDAREAAERLARLLWDFRNGLACCQRCHSRHTMAKKRISVRLVTRKHRQFARELGLEYLIDRLYEPLSARDSGRAAA